MAVMIAGHHQGPRPLTARPRQQHEGTPSTPVSWLVASGLLFRLNSLSVRPAPEPMTRLATPRQVLLFATGGRVGRDRHELTLEVRRYGRLLSRRSQRHTVQPCLLSLACCARSTLAGPADCPWQTCAPCARRPASPTSVPIFKAAISYSPAAWGRCERRRSSRRRLPSD